MDVQNPSQWSAEDTAESDDALIAKTLGGDRSAYDSLVLRHGPRLLTMVGAHVANRDDAEDLVQDALAQAYFKLDTFAGKSAFFTWLYRIAVNLNITRHRKRRLESTHRRSRLEAAPTPQDPTKTADQQLSDVEQAGKLRNAIDRLEEDRRMVLVLRDIEGLDYSEIAKILSIPKGTVRSRLHRARLDLRAELVREGLIEL